MKPWARWAILAASLVVLVILFVILRPEDENSVGVGRTVIEITYRDGAVQGPGTFTVTLGDSVRILVHADVSDEVHFHGYDLMADVTPDEPAVIDFVADAAGSYEVELEDLAEPLIELEIVP
jgi:hypothetical protein